MLKKLSKKALESRQSTYPIHPFILGRWSPRSMSGEEISDDELMALFEAARWAPSSYNGQPWRFIYAKRNTPSWNSLFSLMIEFNQNWTKNAAALLVIISHKVFEHNNKPSITHSFDTGAAWACLALEGASRGLVVHGMQGFDYEKAKTVCNVPDDYQVEAMAAIGFYDQKEKLSKELQEKEQPSTRKPLNEIVMEGSYRE